MSKKKSKKKEKKERLSSASSQEEERKFPQDKDRKGKAVKKKLIGGHSSNDRSAEEPQRKCSSNSKGLPETGHRKDRQLKHPVYRHGKPPGSEKATGKSTVLAYPGTSSFRQDKAAVGVLGDEAAPCQTLGRASSSTQRPGKVTYNTSLTQKQKNPSRKLKQSLSSSSLSAELKEHRITLVKRRSRHEEPAYTGKGQSESPRNPEQPRSLAEELREKRRKLLQRRSQEQRDQAFKAKRELVTGKTLNTAIEETIVQSSTTANNKTSGVSKHRAFDHGSVTQLPKPISGFQVTIPPTKPALYLSFKIPKTTKPAPINPAIWDDVRGTTDAKTVSTHAKSISTVSFRIGPKSSANRTPQEIVPEVPCSSGATPSSPKLRGHGEGVVVHTSPVQRMALPCNMPPWTEQYKTAMGQSNAADNIYGNDQEMQLVEELHQARFENRLELSIVERYGELTCMDIDPPEEGTANTLSKNTLQQNLIIVLDTNILLSHLDYIKKIRSRGLGALGFPIVLVPWVVLQELDSLKNGRRLSSSVAHLATPAVQYIYNSLKNQEPRLWGQSMQQAAQSSYGLNAENNDDRVLQCCLQYQSLYPEGALVLCTNDKNLCSKAMLSGVRALSKADLEVEVAKLKPSLSSFLHSQSPFRPQPNSRLHTQTQTPTYSRGQRGSQTHTQTNTINPTLQTTEEGERTRANDRGRKRGKEPERELSTCLSMLEDCLKSSLSQILETEMKAAYDDLWTEIVYNKPPWAIEELLQCFRKHWIAVFGNIVPRSLLPTVVNLDSFLNSGKPVEQGSTAQALHQAKELLQAFRVRSDYSGLLPAALLSLDGLIHRVSSQSTKNESPERDAPMSDAEEKPSPPSAVTHQEVWSLFEKVWTNFCQISSAVFAALNFDPGTMEVMQLEGSAPPPRDALSFLPNLSSAVTHLLHAFSRLLSPDSDLEDTQALLTFIRSSEIASVEPRLTAKDLLECFTQEEYREKLHVGGFQLTELKVRLDHCVEAMGQMNNPITWP